MPLTESEKSGIRRHLQYQEIGLLVTSPTGGTLASAAASWRFNQAYGFLEYKMNNMNPAGEARLTGAYYGAVSITGAQPNEGDTVSITFGAPTGVLASSPQTIVVTAGAPVPNVDGRLTMLAEIAAQVARNQVLASIGMLALTPFGTGPLALNAVPFPEISFRCLTPFTMSLSANGAVYPAISHAPAQLSPYASVLSDTPVYGYVPILDQLEAALGGASQNLDTYKAAVWTGRMNEIGQRISLYKEWQGRLSDFLGVPLNLYRRNFSSQHGAMRFA